MSSLVGVGTTVTFTVKTPVVLAETPPDADSPSDHSPSSVLTSSTHSTMSDSPVMPWPTVYSPSLAIRRRLPLADSFASSSEISTMNAPDADADAIAPGFLASGPILLICNSKQYPGALMQLAPLLHSVPQRPNLDQPTDLSLTQPRSPLKIGREVILADDHVAAEIEWRKRESGTSVDPDNRFAAILMYASTDDPQSELDQLLASIQPSRSLHVVVTYSRWRQLVSGLSEPPRPRIIDTNTNTSEDPRGTPSTKSRSVSLSPQQRQQWPCVAVTMLLLPFPHRELMKFLATPTDQLQFTSGPTISPNVSYPLNHERSSMIQAALDPILTASLNSSRSSEQSSSGAPFVPQLPFLSSPGRSISATTPTSPQDTFMDLPLPSEYPRTFKAQKSPSSTLGLYTPRSAVRTLTDRHMNFNLTNGSKSLALPSSPSSALDVAPSSQSPTIPVIMSNASPSNGIFLTTPSVQPTLSPTTATSTIVSTGSQLTSPKPNTRTRLARGFAPLEPLIPRQILVVEDNLVNIKMMTMLLTKLGWSLTTDPISTSLSSFVVNSDASPPAARHRVAKNGFQCLEALDEALGLIEQFKATGTNDKAVLEAATRIVPLIILMDISMVRSETRLCCASDGMELRVRSQCLTSSSFSLSFRCLVFRMAWMVLSVPV